MENVMCSHFNMQEVDILLLNVICVHLNQLIDHCVTLT